MVGAHEPASNVGGASAATGVHGDIPPPPLDSIHGAGIGPALGLRRPQRVWQRLGGDLLSLGHSGVDTRVRPSMGVRPGREQRIL